MGKARILVVEDDADIQQLVSYNLIKSGMNVSCADSGEEALQLLNQEQIDLVILDLMLPDRDGMEVCT
ncbi:MAG TPA: response regulator transcription factor, partial [Desulfobulbus sp.]|nr:response regulator transcription factor [Desulfobulbus sp.]